MIPFSEKELTIVGEHLKTTCNGPFPAIFTSMAVHKYAPQLRRKRTSVDLLDRKQPYWFPPEWNFVTLSLESALTLYPARWFIDMEPAPEEKGGKDLFGMNGSIFRKPAEAWCGQVLP
jgi:hypothetical protein